MIQRKNPYRAAQFSNEFLPYSQSFIYNELIAHRRYSMEAFAQKRQFERRFPFEPVHVLGRCERPMYLAARCSRTFDRVFKTRRFSLIHAQFGPSAVYAEPFARRFRLPLVCTFGGIDVAVLETPILQRPDYWFYRFHAGTMFRRIDRIFAVSRNLADRLAALGAPRDRISVFYRGIDIPDDVSDRSSKSESPVTFLMVGRLVEKKGFMYGIRAFARAAEQERAIQLRIIGSGPLESDLRETARENGVADAVVFTGHCPQKTVFEEMRAADVLMVPSVTPPSGDTEGVPNVIKEASARGLPGIVSDHGGLPEVVDDGVTGYVTGERDVREMSERMISFVRNRGERLDMGGAARERMIRDFSMEARIAVLEAAYDDVFDEYYHRGTG